MSSWQIGLSEQERARLRVVGYWFSAAQPELLDPAAHVDVDWLEDERRLTIAYLRSGPSCARWCGYSTCRLCGETGRELGDADITDGSWIWPEGLAHYLERHWVRPPEAFLLHIRQGGFRLSGAIVSAESTISRLRPELLRGMERSEDEAAVRFRLARAAGLRDLYLGVEIDKVTGSFRFDINDAALAAESQRVERMMNPPPWRRIVRLLTGL